MYGKVREDVREILRTLCKYKKVEIIEGAVCAGHVHLCLSIPPKLRVSDFMGYLKGKSALRYSTNIRKWGTNGTESSGQEDILSPQSDMQTKKRLRSTSLSNKKILTKKTGRLNNLSFRGCTHWFAAQPLGVHVFSPL